MRDGFDSTRAFYFGTYGGPGHYLRDDRWGLVEHPWSEGLRDWRGVGPWGWPDGKRLPVQHHEDGEARICREDGWTIVAFRCRCWDSRSSCNSAFIFDAEMPAAHALRLARERFGHLFDKDRGGFPFDIVIVEEDPS